MNLNELIANCVESGNATNEEMVEGIQLNYLNHIMFYLIFARKYMIGIYKITNPEGKVYVGQSVNIEERFKAYKRGNSMEQYLLFRSLIKYGYINHTFEILEQCDVEDLNVKEREWQDKFDVSSSNGLNCHLVGCDGKKQIFSAESVEKMSASAKSRIVSDLKRKKQSETMKGRRLTEEQKLKISIANKGRDHWWHKGVPKSDEVKNKIGGSLKKPILQYSKDGIFLKRWDSSKSASEFYKSSGSSLSACLNGKNKTAMGFIWKNEQPKP